MAALHIVLVEPEIPWNTGNIGRTALAVDAQLHLVSPLGFSLEDKQLQRAGLDYWPRVRLTVWPDWPTFEAELPRLGTAFYFSASAERAHWDVAYPEQTVLVLGRESVGLPRPLLEHNSPQTLKIPMADAGIRSLNLSTAAALAAYEVIRQRRSR